MRSLPDPGFADDGGAADRSVLDALSAYDGDGVGARVLVALSQSRLLVPVVAIAAEVDRDDTGLASDKQTDIAAVLMQGRDGRKALLAFTSLDTLHAWNSRARPVPVSAQDAARSAVQEGAGALVIDVGGPVMFAVETSDLRQLAAGRQLVHSAAGYAWLDGGAPHPA